MEITCLQMDVLISFYIDGDLSEKLKNKVEEHLKECSVCRAKYNIITSLFSDVKTSKTESYNKEKDNHTEAGKTYPTNIHATKQYQFFTKNLSAYIDNELPEEDNVKIRKYTISNKQARKELEDTYRIRKLMKDSYKKTKENAKSDFSKNIMKQLDIEYKNELRFNPLISVAFAFLMTVMIISAIVIYILSL